MADEKKAPAAKAAAGAKAGKAAKASTNAAAAKASSQTVVVTQVGSPIGRRKDQQQTLIGLGLNKLRRTRELADTPAVRGMIEKVKQIGRAACRDRVCPYV